MDILAQKREFDKHIVLVYNGRRIVTPAALEEGVMLTRFGPFLFFIFALFVATFTPLVATQAADVASDAEIKAALEPLVSKTATDLGITNAQAAIYLFITYRGVEAKLASDKLAAQRSEVLMETANAYGLVAASINRMEPLLARLKEGTPGTDIPAELVLKINKTSALASQAIVAFTSAVSKRSVYMADWFVQSGSCKGPTLSSCADDINRVLDVVSGDMDMMEDMIGVLDVFATAVVKHMTY